MSKEKREKKENGEKFSTFQVFSWFLNYFRNQKLFVYLDVFSYNCLFLKKSMIFFCQEFRTNFG